MADKKLKVYVKEGKLEGLREHVAREAAARGLPAEFTTEWDAEEVDVILADPKLVVEELNTGKKLKWFQSVWAGVNILFSGKTPLARRDMIVTRASGMFGELMAEYVFGFILWRERRFDNLRASQQTSTWEPTPVYRTKTRSLKALTLGILGYGEIGGKVGEAAKAFGMKVLGLTRTEREGVDGVALTTDPRVVFKEADYIVNVMPETEETKGMVTEELLGLCKGREVVFMNCGRGSVVDAAVLVAALDSACLAHAVLDVFPVEPLPTSSPLWQHPHVTITPHIAAITSLSDIGSLFLDNMSRFLTSQPLLFPVDFDRQY